MRKCHCIGYVLYTLFLQQHRKFVGKAFGMAVALASIKTPGLALAWGFVWTRTRHVCCRNCCGKDISSDVFVVVVVKWHREEDENDNNSVQPNGFGGKVVWEQRLENS